MRILLVINGTDFGGTEVSLAQVAMELVRRGHDVRVLSLKPVGPVGRRLTAAGVAVSSLDMAESVGVMGLVRGSVALARVIRRERYDVVHSLLPRANIVSRIANRLSGAPRPHFAGERSTDFRRSRAVLALNRLTAPWSDAVLAVTPAVRDVLIARDRIPAEQILVLPNGIDLREIDAMPRTDVRRELGIPPSAPIVCSVGRLIPDKGHVYLTRALARLGPETPAAHLVLVGGGPEETRLRAEAEALGLTPRLHCLGFRDDAIGILKSADVVVLPSLEEGSPVVLLEAMGSARPVIATSVGGVPALVESGRTGLLVPPAELWGNGASDGGDAQRERGVAALAAALGELLGDRARAQDLGTRARRFVESSHSVGEVVARLERVYAGAGSGSVETAAVAAGGGA